MSSDQGSQLVPKRVKVTLEEISQGEIDKLNALHEDIRRDVDKIARKVVQMGKLLSSIKGRLPHGRWNRWVEAHLHFTVRTATRYMNAYAKRDELLRVGPEVFLRDLWGHKPKALEEGSGDDGEQDQDDDEQSGGEGFSEGLGEPTLFSDKGKASFSRFKELVGRLEREYFSNPEFTRESKLDFINELIGWLENQRKNLR